MVGGNISKVPTDFCHFDPSSQICLKKSINYLKPPTSDVQYFSPASSASIHETETIVGFIDGTKDGTKDKTLIESLFSSDFALLSFLGLRERRI